MTREIRASYGSQPQNNNNLVQHLYLYWLALLASRCENWILFSCVTQNLTKHHEIFEDNKGTTVEIRTINMPDR